MIRSPDVEMEAQEIAQTIWQKMNTGKDFPRVESKHGGSSAAYYSREHCVRVRSNVWNKLMLAQKRLLMIHELYHASGHTHDSYFLSSLDFVSLEIYKRIWGQDEVLNEFQMKLKSLVDEATK